MRAKSESFNKNNIFVGIEKELERVKAIYDKDLFLVKKNNSESIERNQGVYYLKLEDWVGTGKLKYYLQNIKEFASYGSYHYMYSCCDKDDTYTTKGIDEFTYPRI